MKKAILFVAIYFLGLSLLIAQDKPDFIYTKDDAFKVNVKEVTETSVLYTNEGDTVVNQLSLSEVTKIVYGSGEVMDFTEPLSFPVVKSGKDWEAVLMTNVLQNVSKLHKLEQVSANAEGSTRFSDFDNIKDRSIKKMKIEAAMMGGNVIYVWQGTGRMGSPMANTSATVSGIAYTNQLPDYQALQKMFDSKKTYRYMEKYSLGKNSADMDVKDMKGKTVTFNHLEQKEGMIYLWGTIPKESSEQFRVAYFDDEQIVLVKREKNQIYNLVFQP